MASMKIIAHNKVWEVLVPCYFNKSACYCRFLKKYFQTVFSSILTMGNKKQYFVKGNFCKSEAKRIFSRVWLHKENALLWLPDFQYWSGGLLGKGFYCYFFSRRWYESGFGWRDAIYGSAITQSIAYLQMPSVEGRVPLKTSATLPLKAIQNILLNSIQINIE